MIATLGQHPNASPMRFREILSDRFGVFEAVASVREIQRFVAALPDQDLRSPEEITAQLNAVFAREPSGRAPALRRAQARAIGADCE